MLVFVSLLAWYVFNFHYENRFSLYFISMQMVLHFYELYHV